MVEEERSSNNHNTHDKTIDQQNIEEPGGEHQQIQQQIVPVLKEDYSISKETTIKEVKILKMNDKKEKQIIRKLSIYCMRSGIHGMVRILSEFRIMSLNM